MSVVDDVARGTRDVKEMLGWLAPRVGRPWDPEPNGDTIIVRTMLQGRHRELVALRQACAHFAH